MHLAFGCPPFLDTKTDKFAKNVVKVMNFCCNFVMYVLYCNRKQCEERREYGYETQFQMSEKIKRK